MDLNEDALVEILLPLPVKSLFRFRSVCKWWCNIIDSSIFRKSHLLNHSKTNNDDILFLEFKRKSKWEVSIIVPDKWNKWYPGSFQSLQKFLNANANKYTKIIGPINGLLCFYDKYRSRNDVNHLVWSLYLAICNPCLGEITIIPPSPVCSTLTLLDDERDNYYCMRDIGFGFVHDYIKIVQITRAKSTKYHIYTYHVEVYSGTTNTWKKLGTDLFDGQELKFRECWMCNVVKSTSHWWKREEVRDEDVILSFDMQNEVFEIIRLPDCLRYFRYDVFAKENNNNNSFVLFVYTHTELKVWELESTGKERRWTHIRSVIRNVNYAPALQPIALWKDGVLMGNGEQVIFWDYSMDKQTKLFETPGYNPRILEYKCSLNSLELCLNSLDN